MSEIQYFCEVRFCHYPYGGISHLPKFKIERSDKEFSSSVDLIKRVKSEVARDLFESLKDYACHIEYRVIGTVPFNSVDVEAKSKWHKIDGRVEANEPKEI